MGRRLHVRFTLLFCWGEREYKSSHLNQQFPRRLKMSFCPIQDITVQNSDSTPENCFHSPTLVSFMQSAYAACPFIPHHIPKAVCPILCTILCPLSIPFYLAYSEKCLSFCPPYFLHHLFHFVHIHCLPHYVHHTLSTTVCTLCSILSTRHSLSHFVHHILYNIH